MVKGSIEGGATNSGIATDGKLGRITVGGDIQSDDSTKPVTIRALGTIGAVRAADALAIAGVKVGGAVENARILAGFRTGNVAINPDAGIGAITVGKTWKASSVSAGVQDTSTVGDTTSAPDGFGRNDTLIPGDTTSAIAASIASIRIKGSAIGSGASGDFYGIAAQSVGALSIAGAKVVRTGADTLLDVGNGDFRLILLA